MSGAADNAWASAVTTHGALPKVAWGQGIDVYDSAGRRYIDASGGPALFCLGHGHPEVNAAIQQQLDRIAHGYRYNFSSDAQEELTAQIIEACAGACAAGAAHGEAGGGGAVGASASGGALSVKQGAAAQLQSVLFTTGGSEAVESALKIALQYHSARGEISRRRFISRRRSWHGNTLGALSVSDFTSRRAPFEGALIEASFLSAVNEYRPPAGMRAAGDTASAVAAYCADELEREIERLGASNVAAFIFEPVVGAAGGVVPAPCGYAQRVRDICSRQGVLMIADEVMCGAGRCGTWRALEHDGVTPDIMAIAKGLGGGYIPLGAVVYSRGVAEELSRHDGGPLTGHTFTAHTTACAAGAAVQRILKRDGLVERVRTEGERFKQQIAGALKEIDAVGDVRGRGFFVGVELVANRQTREPFEASMHMSARVGEQALQRELLCYPTSGNVGGMRGDVIILSPPFNASRAELDDIVERFAHSVRAAVGGP